MSITKTQKAALVRKASQIVNQKREKFYADFYKNFVPNKEEKALLDRVSKVEAAYKKLEKVCKDNDLDISFWNCYIQFYYPNQSFRAEQSFKNTLYFHDEDNLTERVREAIATAYADKEMKEKNFPGEDGIADELELASLDKSFDMEAFMSKYNNL